MKKVLILTMVLCMGVVGTSLAGNLLQERWDNPTGSPARDNFNDLAALQTWMTTTPQSTNWPKLVSQLQYAEDGTDYFCSRITGWLVPPTTGTYTFYMLGDDNSRLWLNYIDSSPMSMTAVPICMHNGSTGWTEWAKYPDTANPSWNQKSAPIELEAGKAYWIRGLFRDGTGGGIYRVNWEGPSIAQQDIPAQYLRDIPWGAGTPTPKDGTKGLNQGPITLSWADRYDPSVGAIKAWKVYIGTEPNDLTATLLETVNEPTRTVNGPSLVYDTTYYWRVDAVADDANGTIGKGNYWSFATKIGKPIIKTQPVNSNVGLNCVGSFSIVAESGENKDGGVLAYAWKKVGDPTTLSVLDSFSTGVAGLYYCDVTNDFGTTKSNEVELYPVPHHPPLEIAGIGNSAGVAGTGVTINGGEVTVVGSGNDIWNTSDGFEFAYVKLVGDCDISVRMTALSTNVPSDDADNYGWTKAGVMIRDDLTPESVHAFAVCTTGSGLAWQGRKALGNNNGNSSSQLWSAGTSGTPPTSNAIWPYKTPGNANWIRLVRVGNTCTPYASQDGVIWQQLVGNTEIAAPFTFPMTDPVYVGIAVTAHLNNSLSTAVVDNLSGFGASWKAVNGDFSPKTPEGWANPAVDNIFTWQKAQFGPCGATYKVYFGETASALTLLGETAVDDPQFTIAANTKIDFDKTYFWRVDTYYGGDFEQGNVWTFDGVKRNPIIRSGPAASTVVNAGATATLNVVATTSTVPVVVQMVSYTWYNAKTNAPVFTGVPEDNDLDGKYNCPLVLTNVQQATEASYYCVVTNTAGPSLKPSPTGFVLTRRLVLYYTFEPATVIGDIVKDQSASKFDATFTSPILGGDPAYGGLVDSIAGLGKAVDLIGTADPNGAYLDTNKKASELGILGAMPRSVSVWSKTHTFNDGGLYDVGTIGSTLQDFSFRTRGVDTPWTWRAQFWGADTDFNLPESLGKWMHSVLVYDGARVRLYINGKLRSDWALALNTADVNPFRIGFYNNSRFIGQLDDLRLYNYALNNQEVGQLYTAVVSGSYCIETPTYDFDGNCKVDINDFAAFSAQWMKSTVVKP